MGSKSGINLWASFALLAFAATVTFVYWVSPLGLGFHDGALKKLKMPAIQRIYTFINFLGPMILFFTFIAILTGPKNKRFKNVIFFTIFAVMVSQISMLTYLSI